MMLKKNKKFFIASCIVILLPMFAGFLLWDQLPAQVATHFGRKRRGRSIQQQIICSSRNLSVCFGNAYFM